VPPVPHSDELGALACATALTTGALADWCGLAHSAPTSDVHDRYPVTGAAAPAAASATSAPHEAKARVNPNTQSGNTHTRIRSEGMRAQNVCCLARTSDSHRWRVSILT